MSVDPIRRAASALSYWERRQRAVSHDLANVSTPGYRGSRVFARLLENGRLDVARARDETPGSLEATGRSLDVAIVGDGFFAVRTPDGVRYTRDGSLQIDSDRRLVDREGHPVLGEDGTIRVPPGAVEIDADGTVRVDGREAGRLRLEQVEDGARLHREGGSLLRPEARGEPVDPDEVRIRSGHLEASNVNPVEGMVRMIEVQRAYQSVLRSVQLMDGINETIAGRLGRVE